MLPASLVNVRAGSLVGRASLWHSEGQGFESPSVHHMSPVSLKLTRLRFPSLTTVPGFSKEARFQLGVNYQGGGVFSWNTMIKL